MWIPRWLRRMCRVRALSARGRGGRPSRWIPRPDRLHVRTPRRAPDCVAWTDVTAVHVSRSDGVFLYDSLTIALDLRGRDASWVIHEEHRDFRDVERALAEHFGLGEAWTFDVAGTATPPARTAWRADA